MSNLANDYNKYYLGAKISNYFKPLELRLFKTYKRIVDNSNVAHSIFIGAKIIEMIQIVILLSILMIKILDFNFIKQACFYSVLLDWNDNLVNMITPELKNNI